MMKDATMKMQIKACDYMESTYGKSWGKRNINKPAITNAYIQGYRDKEQEDKTVKAIYVSPKRKEWFKEQLEGISEKAIDKMGLNVGKFFEMKIVSDKKMPEHLGALIDGEGNVIGFIEFKENK